MADEYWGGEWIAASGLVFGALPRLRAAPRRRDALLLGLGLAMHLITRPYESISCSWRWRCFGCPGGRRNEGGGQVPAGSGAVLLAARGALAVKQAVTGSSPPCRRR